MVVDSVFGSVGGFEALPALGAPDAILIGCRIPLNDDVEAFSRRELPGDFGGDCDLSIRSNKLDTPSSLELRQPRVFHCNSNNPIELDRESITGI